MLSITALKLPRRPCLQQKVYTASVQFTIYDISNRGVLSRVIRLQTPGIWFGQGTFASISLGENDENDTPSQAEVPSTPTVAGEPRSSFLIIRGAGPSIPPLCSEGRHFL